MYGVESPGSISQRGRPAGRHDALSYLIRDRPQTDGMLHGDSTCRPSCQAEVSGTLTCRDHTC